jgi:glycosyltransferase involved in cell wall biosynthesis
MIQDNNLYNAPISIITICKDDIDGLKNTIHSTRQLRSDYGVRQIVVFSSTGEHAVAIDEILRDETNVYLYLQEPAGIAAAFNHGLSQAESDWVWFLNSKDEVHPSLDMELLLKVISKTNADLAIFQIECMQSGERVAHPSISALWPPMNWLPHPATVIRRSLYNTYGLFNRDYTIAMDSDMWVRLIGNGVVADMISIPLALYDQTGISSRELIRSKQEDIKIVQSHFITLIKPVLKSLLRLLKMKLL